MATKRTTTSTPPLDHLATELRLVVARLARRLRRAEMSGLTPSQMSTLASISRLQPVRPSDLAAAEQVAAPTLTRIVANMEAQGLVARRSDDGDRRCTRLSLTPEGRARLERARQAGRAALQERLAGLSDDDIDSLARALPVLSDLLDEAAPTPSDSQR